MHQTEGKLVYQLYVSFLLFMADKLFVFLCSERGLNYNCWIGCIEL